MRVFVTTALQSRLRPLDLDTEEGAAALARVMAAACRQGLFDD
jgi:hypothetical protein